MSSSSSTTNDELLHLVEVKEIQGKGRALVSSQPLKAGQIILRDSPILVYSAISLKNGDFSKFCSHCYRVLQQSPSSSSSSSSSSCPSCSYHAIFCSSSCRTMALSSSHSPWVCQSLNSLRYSPRSLLSPDAQIQANFLIAAYNLALVSPSSFQLLLSLQGESPATTPNAQTLELHSLIASLSPPQSSSSTLAGVFSPELTAALLAKDKQNAFGLMEPFQENGERTVRAYGIYPKVSFFNHDCLPNACRFDYVDAVGDQNNTDIIIRAIHDVPQGREICLSYFPVNWNYSDRQRRLMEDYGFACDCDRCKVEVNWKDDVDEEEEEEEMEDGDDVEMEGTDDAEENSDFPHAYFFVSYVCDRDNCGGTLAPLPPSDGIPSNGMECNVCGRLRTEEDIDEDEDGIMLDE